MDASAWQLLLLELALVVVLAVLSAGEAAINIARRPGVIDELSLRGRRGQRASAIGRRAGYYLAAIQVSEFLIVFAYAGIAAAFIAPRLSAMLAFFFGIDTTTIFSDVPAVVVTVAVLSLLAVLLGLFVPRAIAARHRAVLPHPDPGPALRRQPAGRHPRHRGGDPRARGNRTGAGRPRAERARDDLVD